MMNSTQQTTSLMVLALTAITSLTASSPAPVTVADVTKQMIAILLTMPDNTSIDDKLAAKIASRRDSITPLMNAAMSNDIALIIPLIATGADVDAIDCTGETALIFAAMNGHLDTARILVQRTKNIDHVDAFGMSALTYAAKNGYEALTSLLATKGARPDIADFTGKTAKEYVEEQMRKNREAADLD